MISCSVRRKHDESKPRRSWWLPKLYDNPSSWSVVFKSFATSNFETWWHDIASDVCNMFPLVATIPISIGEILCEILRTSWFGENCTFSDDISSAELCSAELLLRRNTSTGFRLGVTDLLPSCAIISKSNVRNQSSSVHSVLLKHSCWFSRHWISPTNPERSSASSPLLVTALITHSGCWVLVVCHRNSCAIDVVL